MNNEITKTVDDTIEEKDFFELKRRGINKKLSRSLTDETGKAHHSHEERSDCLARRHREGDPIKTNPV